MQIKLPFSIPINYKTIILGVMAIIIVILLIASLIVTKNKSAANIPIIKKPEIIEPTPVPVKKLPSEIQIKIDSINDKINSQPEIEPPVINDKIGL